MKCLLLDESPEKGRWIAKHFCVAVKKHQQHKSIDSLPLALGLCHVAALAVCRGRAACPFRELNTLVASTMSPTHVHVVMYPVMIQIAMLLAPSIQLMRSIYCCCIIHICYCEVVKTHGDG